MEHDLKELGRGELSEEPVGNENARREKADDAGTVYLAGETELDAAHRNGSEQSGNLGIDGDGLSVVPERTQT